MRYLAIFMTSHLKQQTFFSYIWGGGGGVENFFPKGLWGGGRQIVCSPHENVTASPPPSPRLVINDSSLAEMWNKQIIVPDKYDTFSNCA